MIAKFYATVPVSSISIWNDELVLLQTTGTETSLSTVLGVPLRKDRRVTITS